MTIKQREIIIKSLLWFITLFIIIFIGVNKIFADTYEDIGYLSDYSDVIVEVNYTSSPLPLYKDNTYQLTEVIAMNINVSNFTFLGGTTYLLEFWTPDTKLKYANAFTIVANDINNNPVKCTTIGINGPEEFLNFKFNCSSNVNYINLRIYNSSNNYIMDTGIFSWKYVYLRKISSSTDTSILEGQASQIIQGQQDIINNNDTNTNKIIEENKKNFNDCRDSYNLWGDLNWQSGTYSYFKLPKENTYYTLSMKLKEGKSIPDGLYVRFTNTGNYSPTNMIYNQIIGNGNLQTSSINNYKNGEYLNYLSVYPSSYKDNLSEYFDIMLNEGNTALDYEEYGEICTNKLDEANKTSKGILGKLGELITNLFSTEGPDTDDLDNVAGWLPPGPIDSILTLPLSLINAIINGLGSNCSPLSVNLPFVNNTLQIPCINVLFSQISGVSTLYAWFGPIASAFILYYYFKSLYKWVDEKLSLKDSSEWGGV